MLLGLRYVWLNAVFYSQDCHSTLRLEKIVKIWWFNYSCFFNFTIWPISYLQVKFSDTKSWKSIQSILFKTLILTILTNPIQEVYDLHLMCLRTTFKKILVIRYKFHEYTKYFNNLNEEVLIRNFVAMLKLTSDIFPYQYALRMILSRI